VELFAYENPVSPVSQSSSKSFLSTSSLSPVLSYHFHNLLSQERLFLFTSNLEGLKDQAPKSIGELFFSATWLEREVGEMHGVCFEGKKDLRNLMLQYGDTSSPFRKTYPPIGTREVCYDPVTDALAQVPVSIQS
jgi:NADH:ubiquinone oxidoreductase subunit C